MKSMIKDYNLIYNLDYITLVPKFDNELIESLDYSIGNICFIEDEEKDLSLINDMIRRSNIKNIIFVDYIFGYQRIIQDLDDSINIKFILSKDLSALSNLEYSKIVENIISLLDMKVIDSLGVLDKNWYDVFKNKYNVVYLKLDIEKNNYKNLKNKRIGILSNSEDNYHNFYNQISAASLNNRYKIALNYKTVRVADFCNTFNITFIDTEEDDYIFNNEINLYINFSDLDITKFLKSMDSGIPCILGNTNLLDDYSNLKDYLVVKSDDNIDEITEKINKIDENYKKIFTEYGKFREKYKEESKRSIKQFIEVSKLNFDYDSSSDILLSVIVPAYNVESYIERCLESVYSARIDKMEVIVINDGSTDRTDEKIKWFISKHPNFIKYISQSNKGIANVRNVGLEHAIGNYITSVDSDDEINDKYFKDIEKYMKENIDLIACDWLSIDLKGQKFETPAVDPVFKDINILKGLLYTSIMPSSCNKIVKTSIVKGLNFKYADGLKYEDLSLTPLFMINCRTIKYINRPYYLYNLRPNSIMRSGPSFDMIDAIKILDERIKSLPKVDTILNLDEFRYYTYLWRIEEFIFNQLYITDNDKINELINCFYDKLYDIMKEIFSSSIYEIKLGNLPSKTKEYIILRNKAFLKGKKEFISFISSVKDNNYIKITAS